MMKMRTLLSVTALGAVLALPLQAQDPYEQPDESWISIDGTVATVGADEFTLDYGDGLVTVEMNDEDRDAHSYELMPGDKVTVTGVIDDDALETASIDASRVYVENLGTSFYASRADEDERGEFLTFATPVVVGRAVIQGTVTSVGEEEFTLSSGGSEITVEVEQMPYDPLDTEGYQRIEVGDIVSVGGHVDIDLFEGADFVAETIVEIVD